MMWSKSLIDLRNLLASLYDDNDSAIQAAEESGLPRAYITEGDTPTATWHNILAEANKLGGRQVIDIIDVARNRWPERTKEFDTYQQAYLEDTTLASVKGKQTKIAKQQEKRTSSLKRPSRLVDKPVPAWFPKMGAIFAGLTFLFFIALVVASMFQLEVPVNSRFAVVVVLALGSALATTFLGGWAVAEGTIPIPFFRENPINISVGGGIAVLFIGLLLGSWLYISPTSIISPTEIKYGGRVSDANTLQPILKAKVSLQLRGATPKTTFTDNEGTFTFSVVFEDNTLDGTVRVEADGYQVFERLVELSAQGKYTEDIRLQKK